MATMKTFAVDVEITVTRTLFVEARRQGGAIEKLSTADGMAEATRYDDDDLFSHRKIGDPGIKVVQVREV